ncbi:probable WRKY transcription factor 51 [Lactuca sativa]|uniref:probable WRKY transcription factor 51 n=1 Tax=Lactuca sativa TaxID=4236 RepID=UPI000CD84332|nr:probable WRKY transcription factor 51 [Lactuca sativa]
MDAFFQPTGLCLSQDQTGNPYSWSSSLNYTFSNTDDQINHFDIDVMLHNCHNLYPNNNNPNPNLPQFIDPPSYQDSSSSNFPAYISTNEQTPILLEMTTAANASESSDISAYATCTPQANLFHSDMCNGERLHDGTKIAFRVRTELEVLDDGYRWRKYGKKKVKSSPNLRNYYKCYTAGCKVKKRVERDRNDSRYVIATYIGRHNHRAQSTIPCNPTGVWTLQFT